jgi:hypothetical protein
MSYTKGDLVKAALNEIGLASYNFDAGAEETESALQELDLMMAEWESIGIRLFYPYSGTANGSSLDEDSGVPLSAVGAIKTNLAILIAPSYGKIVSPRTLSTAKNGLNRLMIRSSQPPEMQLGKIPKGAGYKSEYAFSVGAIDKEVDYVDESIDLSGSPENG